MIKFIGPWEVYFQKAGQQVELGDDLTVEGLLTHLSRNSDSRFQGLIENASFFGKREEGDDYFPLAPDHPLTGISEVLLFGPIEGG